MFSFWLSDHAKLNGCSNFIWEISSMKEPFISRKRILIHISWGLNSTYINLYKTLFVHIQNFQNFCFLHKDISLIFHKIWTWQGTVFFKDLFSWNKRIHITGSKELVYCINWALRGSNRAHQLRLVKQACKFYIWCYYYQGPLYVSLEPPKPF